MRRVAQALDTGAASLYVYVANTAELHAAVLDELIAPLTSDSTGSPDGTGHWQERLEALLHAYSSVLFAFPGLARSALVLRPSGPATIRLFDRILALLLEGGVPTDRAAWGADLLLQHVTANAAEHGSPCPDDIDAPADNDAKRDALARAVHDAAPADTPHVAAHAEAVLAGPPAARSSWAIRALVNGIASTPTRPPAPPRPARTHAQTSPATRTRHPSGGQK